MQSESKTQFENVPDEFAKRIPKYKTPEAVSEILREAPRPCLVVGEVVRFKDMSFRVTRIKADGKVGLRMVP